jgi:beta-lactamase regulating signal transducer with metallopeptidase domain
MSAALAVVDVETACELVLGWLGRGLLLGTILAGLTWALTRVLDDRLSPTVEVALWAVVLIKFVVPVGPEWSYSLASTFRTLSEYSAVGTTTTGVADAEALPSALPAPGARANRGSAAAAWSGSAPLTAVYFAGVLSLLVLRVRSYRALAARCRVLPAADESTRQLVLETCRRLGMRRVPAIRISAESPAPFVMGFLRPLLVLSPRQLARPNELETVVVHELMHLQRGDMFVRLLQWTVGTLLFFWPVVAWVNRRIDRAREYACDEWALRHGKLTAGEYARCLLKAVQPMRAGCPAYQPTCMASNVTKIERRIDVILESNRRSARRPAWGLVTVALLCVWGGFVLTGAADDTGKIKAKQTKYLATPEDMKLHAETVYARVNEYAAGDMNGDGRVTKEECWVFITAAVVKQPEAVLKEYPKADQNGDGQLKPTEAFKFVRGDYVIENLHKKTKSAVTAALEEGDKERAQALKQALATAEIEAWHFILDRRDKLLDLINDEPTAEEVRKVAEGWKKVEAQLAEKPHGDKLAAAMADIVGLKEKAATLRAKAAEIGGAKAAALEDKAANLEQKAADIKAKVTAMLADKIAKLDAAGESEQADLLRAKLAEFEAIGSEGD